MSEDFDIRLERKLESKGAGAGGGGREVARSHGLSPQQLFAWRREARALLHEGGGAAPGDGSAANPAPRPRRGKGRPKPTPEICDDAPAFAPGGISAPAR